MKKMRRYTTLIAIGLLAVACSTDGDDIVVENGSYEPSTEAILFDAQTTGAFTTRAVTGEIDNDANLQSLTFANHYPSANTYLRGFGVFAAYTGALTYENTTVSPDFMYNQQVTYTSGAWNYNPVKFWPNETSDYVSFFAYAPYEPNPLDDGRCIIDASDNSDLGDPWVNYRLSRDPWGTGTTYEPQVDLMYGFNNTTSTDPKPWIDQTKNKNGTIQYGTDAKLPFTFNHALGCFAHEVKLQLSDELKTLLTGYSTITINSFNITYNNLTSKARLVLNPNISGGKAYANWKEIVSGELTATRTTGNISTYPTVGETALSTYDFLTSTSSLTISTDRGLFYIPMIIAGQPAPTATVTINYTITVTSGGATFTGDATATIDLSTYHANTYEGKRTALALTLGKDLDLLHQVYLLGGTATEPSYVRKH